MHRPFFKKILWTIPLFLILAGSAHAIVLNIDPLDPKFTYDHSASLDHCAIYKITHISLGTFLMGNVSVTKTIYEAQRVASLTGKSSGANLSLWRPGADEGVWPLSQFHDLQRVEGYDDLQVNKTYLVCYDGVSKLILVAYYGSQEAVYFSFSHTWKTVNDPQDLGFFPPNSSLPVTGGIGF